jgi:ABC-type Fe3+/spermidine/putrescine transport system ATPase subunit
MAKLIMRDLAMTYGDFVAVKSLNLELQEGEFVSLLGPSGCGKTTTLRMLAGFIKPSHGTIEMDGKIISSPSHTVQPEHRQMSMIFQSYAVWPNMTVGENVAFGLKLRQMSKDVVNRKVGEILDVVHLSHLIDRYPAELSGGQQQRVALARAIVVQPAVLLLDEPLSNLDASLREEMRYEIRRLHDEFRITTVYVTHDQAEAMVTSDRIAVMNQGQIEQVGSPHEIYDAPRTKFVASFIGRTNFLRGNVRGGKIEFDGFAVPTANVKCLRPLQGEVLFSLRPQAIHVHRQSPGESNRCCYLLGRIVQRGYLGEYWDYVVKPECGENALRVVVPPQFAFEAEETVWLEIDPAAMSHITESADL